MTNSQTVVTTVPALEVAVATSDGTGRLIGPYQLKYELGRGAMGTVYLASHAKLKRQVALKLLPQGFGAQLRIAPLPVRREFDLGAVDQLPGSDFIDGYEQFCFV